MNDLIVQLCSGIYMIFFGGCRCIRERPFIALQNSNFFWWQLQLPRCRLRAKLPSCKTCWGVHLSSVMLNMYYSTLSCRLCLKESHVMHFVDYGRSVQISLVQSMKRLLKLTSRLCTRYWIQLRYTMPNNYSCAKSRKQCITEVWYSLSLYLTFCRIMVASTIYLQRRLDLVYTVKW